MRLRPALCTPGLQGARIQVDNPSGVAALSMPCGGLLSVLSIMRRALSAGGAPGGTQWDAAYRVLQHFAGSRHANSLETEGRAR